MLKRAGKFLWETSPPKAALDVLQKFDESAYKAGGFITDKAAPVVGPDAAAALGFGTNFGLQMLPMAAGGPVGGALGKPGFQAGAKSIMQSALKPDKAARESGDAASAIETLLEKGINVTQGGVEKLTAQIDKLDDALSAALAGAKGDVSTISVIRPVQMAVNKFKDGLDQAKNTQAVRDELFKFFDHPEVQGAFQIPVELAQRMKRAIYTEVGDKGYGFGIKPMAEREGKKAVARGLKEGLERAVPEAAEANKAMGPLINARDLAQDRVLTAGNKNPMGLGLLSSPSHWLPWLADRSELAKSAVARLLYSGGIPESAGRVAGAAEGARMGKPEKDP